MKWLGIDRKLGDEGFIAMTSCIDKVEDFGLDTRTTTTSLQ